MKIAHMGSDVNMDFHGVGIFWNYINVEACRGAIKWYLGTRLEARRTLNILFLLFGDPSMGVWRIGGKNGEHAGPEEPQASVEVTRDGPAPGGARDGSSQRHGGDDSA